jgi:signal transduction histidine kinase/ActR/RegA family two-component response regulator
MKISFSIRSFLVFLAICFAVPAVLLFGLFEAWSGIRKTREDAREMNRQAAVLIEHDISASLQEFKAFSEALAIDINLDTLKFEDPEHVLPLLKLYPDIDYLVLNDKGVSVATYSVSREIQTGVDYSDRRYVKQAFASRKTVISGAIQTRTANTPAVIFLVPLIDAQQVIRGFLGGGVPTEQFRTRYQLAPEQYALVKDTFGSTVSSINLNPSQPEAGDELNVVDVKPIGWKVIVGLPRGYVTAGARRAIYNAILVALICTLIGAAVASVVAFSTVRGIDNIGRQVQGMSALDLKPIELPGTGLYPREVRSLIGNFNNLLDRTARMQLAEIEAISHLADTILVTAADGSISYLNDAGIQLFGDIRGRHLHEIVGTETARNILSPKPPRAWKGEVLVTKSSGNAFDAFLSATPVLEIGELASAVIIIQDITHEKAARDARSQSEKMITLGELVAGTSHELNNPLAIVTGYADLLLYDNGLDAGQRAKIESIRKNAHRAANIVHSLLAFARKHKPERSQTNANSVVSAALQLKDYDLRTSGILIDNRLAEKLPAVFADPNQLQQVILNVLNNAQDAVLASSNPRRIGITTEALDGRVCIRIEDSGAGISKEDLRKVFDPFFTTKPLGKGTGLGLSISYGIVREHGGDIQIRSQLGQRTQVAITLPAYSPLSPEPPAKAIGPVSVRRRRLLVVDDEVEIASIIQTVATRNGSIVDTASSLDEAMRLATASRYDFVISDIKMPGGSGIDLYKRLSAAMPIYKRRFLFLTGDTSNPSTVQFLEREGLPYFPKPCDFDTIQAFLNETESQTMRG